MNKSIEEIKLRFNNCEFTKPLSGDTINEKILDKLSIYKSATVSRGGKLIIDFGDDDDFIIKIDLFSKVSSLTADQFFFYKENVRDTSFAPIMAELKAFTINDYYIYIQEKVIIYDSVDDYLLNPNFFKYNLCQVNKQTWQRLLEKYDFPVSDQLIYWCHIASCEYNKIILVCFLFLLRKHMRTDLNKENIGFNNQFMPKIIDF